MAGGGRAQAGGEVAEARAYGDAGAQGEYGRLDLGGAVRRRGDLGGEGVPGEVDGGAHAAFSAEVAEGGGVGGAQDGLRGERRPLGVVGGAEAEGFGGLVQGDGDGEGGRGVLFGEGVQFAGEAAGPVGHAGGSVAGGGPAGGVACGQAEQQAFDSAVRAPSGLRRRVLVACRPAPPHRPCGCRSGVRCGSRGAGAPSARRGSRLAASSLRVVPCVAGAAWRRLRRSGSFGAVLVRRCHLVLVRGQEVRHVQDVVAPHRREAAAAGPGRSPPPRSAGIADGALRSRRPGRPPPPPWCPRRGPCSPRSGPTARSRRRPPRTRRRPGRRPRGPGRSRGSRR